MHRWIRSDQAWRRFLVVIVALAMSVSMLPPASARAETAGAPADLTWTARTGATSESLKGIAHGSGRIVVVGHKGTVLTSADGKSWSPVSSGTARNLQAVTYGNGQFVAVGEGGTVLTSPDGTAWTAAQPGVTSTLEDVTYGNGLYVAVGDGGKILTSANGSAWTARSTGTEAKLYAVAWGGGQFVAVGYMGAILTSTDGVTWTRRGTPTSKYLSGIAYGNGRYVAVGEDDTVLTSANAANWTAVQTPDYMGLWRVTYGDGLFVGVGGAGNIFASADGIAWTRHDNDRTFTFIDDVIFIGDQFAAVGDQGTIRTSLAQPLKPAGKDGTPPPTEPLPTEPLPTEPVNEPEPMDEPDPSNPPAQPQAPAEGRSCVNGKVSGKRTEYRLQELLVEADLAVSKPDGTQEFCGNITLNRMLKLDGSLIYDRKKLELKGSGTLYIEAPPFANGTVELFAGDFTFNGDLTELVKQNGLDKLRLGGMQVKVNRLHIFGDGFTVAGELRLPMSLIGTVAELEELTYRSGRFVLKSDLKLPDTLLANTPFYIKNIKVDYDGATDSFDGGAEFEIPNMLGLEAALGIRHGRLEKVGFGVSKEPGLAIDASGLFMQSLYGELDGLSNLSALKITAKTTISGGPQIMGFTAIKGEDLALTVDLSGKLSGSGMLVLAEQIELAKGSFEISKLEGFKASAELTLADVVRANAEVRVSADELYGTATGIFTIPKDLGRPYGGKEIGRSDLRVDRQALSANLKIWNILTLGVRRTWDGKWERVATSLGSFAHRVPLVASTGAVALAPQNDQFVVPAGATQIVVGLSWDEGDADFELISPDGTVITPASVAANPESLYYENRADERYAFYVLIDPQPGTWKYRVDSRGARTYTLEIDNVDRPPSFTMTAPATDTAASGAVTLAWDKSVAPGSTVDLFYATGPDDLGILIAADVDASLGTYTWNTAGVQSGTYRVYALLDDGKTAPVKALAPGKVTVANPRAPAVPRNLTARSVNGELELSWAPNPEPDLAGYRLTLLNTGETVAIGKQASFTWEGLAAGKNYQVAITAFNAEGFESPQSAPVTVSLVAPRRPGLEVSWPDRTITNQEGLTVRGQVEAGATATIYLDDAVVASGLTGSFERQVTLRSGRNVVRVVAARPNGDATELAQEYLLDTIPPQLTVRNLTEKMQVAAPVVLVSGTVEPTATLTLNGRTVPVMADGSYSVTLNLAAGANQVELVATDRAGNTMTFAGVITATATATSACGTVFPDVGANHPACAAIEQLAALKVLGGYPDGTFQPDRTVTRAEFAKMLVSALGRAPRPAGPLPFGDARGHWAANGGYLQAAVDLGAISGFPDGSFRPDDPVTRAQVVKIVAAAAGLNPVGAPAYPDIRADDWYAGWVSAARTGRLIGASGATALWASGNFDGDRPATRAEAAIILANLLNRP